MLIENNRRLTGKAAVLLCAVFMLIFMQFPLLGFARVAHADGGLQISAVYPNQSVKSGSDYSFYIKVKNNTGKGQTVSFNGKLPDGWSYVLQGGGNQIYKVYVEESSTADVNLNVTVPREAATGKYNVELTGTGQDGVSDKLTIVLDVTSQGTNKGEWKTDGKSQNGSNTDTFAFTTAITNNSGADQSYSLNSDAPVGWNVTFTSSDKQIASCSVSPGGTESVGVNIVPAYNTTPGDYTVKCTAVSGNETLSADLKLKVTGSYSMELTTPTGRLNAEAYAEKETPISLEIRNTGSSDLTNIKLSTGYVPTGWTVRFDKKSIDLIPAGGKESVTAYVKAGSAIVVGDYEVDLAASSSQTSAQCAFWVAFKATVVWGYVGIIIILLLIAGLIGVFSKYGRR